MWPLFKKEIREHLVLACAALGVNGLLLAGFALGYSNGVEPVARQCLMETRRADGGESTHSMVAAGRRPANVGIPPLADTRLLWRLLVTGGAFAAALGLMQTLGESAKDTYPFLLHRPPSRLRLLMGKVCAGAALYSVCMLAPLAGLVCWASRPGVYCGPFEPAMVLPGLMVVACGFLFYLGGILVGLTPGRWYGARPAGLVACVMAVYAACPAFAPLPIGAAVLLASALLLLWAAAATILGRSF